MVTPSWTAVRFGLVCVSIAALSGIAVYWIQEAHHNSLNQFQTVETELEKMKRELETAHESLRVQEQELRDSQQKVKSLNNALWDSKQEAQALNDALWDSNQKVKALEDQALIAEGKTKELISQVSQLESDTQILATCMKDVKAGMNGFPSLDSIRSISLASVGTEFVGMVQPLSRLYDSWTKGACNNSQPLIEKYAQP